MLGSFAKATELGNLEKKITETAQRLEDAEKRITETVQRLEDAEKRLADLKKQQVCLEHAACQAEYWLGT
jgi:septal ring factor EnvC (AmiA/AmiB activator)